MTARATIEGVLHELYAARVRGNLEAVCATFTDDARFQIASASHVSPVAVATTGSVEYRPLLALLIKTFRLTDLAILAMIVDELHSSAAVHWQAAVHSRITGGTVMTELVDLVEIRDGRIATYREFFVPRP